MKVALFLCPEWNEEYSTAGLACLAAALQAAGHEAAVYDLNRVFALLDRSGAGAMPRASNVVANPWLDPAKVREQFERHRAYLSSLVERVLSGGCRVVGFSVYYCNAQMSLQLARLFKSRDPDVVTVFGGGECQTFQRACRLARQAGVDAVVYGEGELALTGLVASLERGGRLTPAPGVLVAGEPSSWRDEQQPVADLDSLALADFGDRSPRSLDGKAVNTSRGCVRRCEFCSDWRVGFRRMGGRRIFEEFRHQLERHPRVNRFYLADSLVNGTMKSLVDFCGLAGAEKLAPKWEGMAIVRPDMTRGALEAMRESGCHRLAYGVESGSERLRKVMNKQIPSEAIDHVLGDTVRAGIRAVAMVMVGYPGETEEDFQATVELIRRNAGSISQLAVSVFGAGDLEGREGEFGIALAGEGYDWRSLDGSNTFPIRLERVRRLARAAMSSGVDMTFQYAANEGIEACCSEMLDAYGRRAAPAALP